MQADIACLSGCIPAARSGGLRTAVGREQPVAPPDSSRSPGSQREFPPERPGRRRSLPLRGCVRHVMTAVLQNRTSSPATGAPPGTPSRPEPEWGVRPLRAQSRHRSGYRCQMMQVAAPRHRKARIGGRVGRGRHCDKAADRHCLLFRLPESHQPVRVLRRFLNSSPATSPASRLPTVSPSATSLAA